MRYTHNSKYQTLKTVINTDGIYFACTQDRFCEAIFRIKKGIIQLVSYSNSLYNRDYKNWILCDFIDQKFVPREVKLDKKRLLDLSVGEFFVFSTEPNSCIYIRTDNLAAINTENWSTFGLIPHQKRKTEVYIIDNPFQGI